MAEMDKIKNESAIQDILHSLELVEHNYYEYAKLAKELTKCRRKRRDSKNVIECVAPIIQWSEDNKPVVKKLEALLGAVRRAEKGADSRVYTFRTCIIGEEGKILK